MARNDEHIETEADTTSDATLLARRDFLIGLRKWSAIVIGGALLGGLAEPTEAGGWVNSRGSWINGGHGGWVNRGGSWVNGGGSWINRGGGGWVNGGGAWVNGGGGSAWVNRRG